MQVKRLQQKGRRITKKIISGINEGPSAQYSELSQVRDDRAQTLEGLCNNEFRLSGAEVTEEDHDASSFWATIDDFGSVESSSSDECEEPRNMRSDLRNWSEETNVTNTALTSLLKVLHKHGMDVPLRAETLKKTPRGLNIERKSGGEYVYLGVEQNIRRAIADSAAPIPEKIQLRVNVDGLPIFKSKQLSLWPIQCSITDFPKMQPLIVALFCANHKPQTLEFLDDFVDEMKSLMENGIYLSGRDSPVDVCIHSFVCDAPARALVKGTVQYNGFFGCDYCEERGTYDGRMTFLQNGTRRTNESFREKRNPEHHKHNSPLLSLNIDMVNDFPIDPMHAVDLGVTKKMLLLWKEGPRPTRLSGGQLGIISTFLLSARAFIPPSFNRKPRGLEEVKLWKASELRTFLLYMCPLALKSVLPSVEYDNMMCLHVAMTILYSSTLLVKYKGYADELLKTFTHNSACLYGNQFLSYNSHALTHLPDVAARFSGLNNCTAYEFENNMSSIKRRVRGTGSVITQIYNRLEEQKHARINRDTRDEVLRLKIGYCVKLRNRSFGYIREIHPPGTTYTIDILDRMFDAFTKPCRSSILGIHLTSVNHTSRKIVGIDCIEDYAVCIPLSLLDTSRRTEAVVMPLVHTN